MISINSNIKLNDGNSIPVLGFGTWQITGKDVETSVLAALSAGYRLIDTAFMYRNEKEIGRAIKKSGLERKDIFITTKIWETQHTDPESAVEGSLRDLDIDYIDLYLIHWPEEERLATWKMFEKFKKQGLCRSIGVSNFTIRHLKELMEVSGTVPAVNQVEFNPFLYQKELLEFCRSNKILVEGYCPLSRARMLDNKRLDEVAKKYNKSPAQIMLRWAVQHGIVPIPKSVNRKRIEENSDIFDLSISVPDMEALNGINKNFRICSDPADAP